MHQYICKASYKRWSNRLQFSTNRRKGLASTCSSNNKRTNLYDSRTRCWCARKNSCNWPNSLKKALKIWTKRVTGRLPTCCDSPTVPQKHRLSRQVTSLASSSWELKITLGSTFRIYFSKNRLAPVPVQTFSKQRTKRTMLPSKS